MINIEQALLDGRKYDTFFIYNFFKLYIDNNLHTLYGKPSEWLDNYGLITDSITHLTYFITTKDEIISNHNPIVKPQFKSKIYGEISKVRFRQYTIITIVETDCIITDEQHNQYKFFLDEFISIENYFFENL